MRKILWLDDFRNPFLNIEGRVPDEKGVVEWVLNYDEFVQWIEKFGLPAVISFDHDLGGEEIFLPINNYEGLYEISNFGNVNSISRNTTSGGILKPDMNLSGLMVTLRNSGNDKKYSIHKLVADHFIIKPKGKSQINHKNGNRWDNHFENLEWVTNSENVKHSHDYLDREYTAYGENHNNSQTISKYDKENNYLGTYGSINEASRQENIDVSNISKCANGKRKYVGGFIWKNENKKVDIPSVIKHIKPENKNYIGRFNIPNYKEKTGMECAKWLVNYCIDNKKPLPIFYVHSANPVGADNIRLYLENYLKHTGQYETSLSYEDWLVSQGIKPLGQTTMDVGGLVADKHVVRVWYEDYVKKNIINNLNK